MTTMQNPMRQQNDLIVGGAGGTPQRLGRGPIGQVLTVLANGLLGWAAASGGTAGYDSAVLADNPSQFWHLDDPNDQAAALGIIRGDRRVGAGRLDGTTAIPGGGTGWSQPGAPNGPLEFEDSGCLTIAAGSLDYLILPFTNNLSLTGCTVEFMMKIATGATAAGATQLMFMDAGAPKPFVLGSPNGTTQWWFLPNDAVFAPNLPDLRDTIWHHFAITQVAANNDWRMYFDGAPTASGVEDAFGLGTATRLLFGNGLSGNPLTTPTRFSRVALYPSVLSATRILAHYQAMR